ncbi:MAG: hypothetical protein ACPGTP_07570 [Bacteroidia bacterium]
MKKNYLLIGLSCLLLAACSSGKKRLEKGDYDTAVYKAVKRLNQKPNYHKAEKVLREAYTLAVNEHMQVIEYHDKTSNKFKYDRMVREYEMITHLNSAIRRYPMYSDLVSLVDVSDELAFVSMEAAIAHKLEGERLLSQNTKQRARDAFHHYVSANSFVEGIVSARILDDAQEAGTVNVVLEFSNNGSFFRSFNTDKVYNHISNGFRNTRYRFLRVLEPGELDIVPDEIVQIEMDEAHVGGVDFSKNVFELTKENVYMGEAETDSGEVVKVYGTVTADYIEYCKTVHSRARIMVQRIDGNTAAIKHRRVMPSSYAWSEKWATYRGDKRALSSSQLSFAKRSEPRSPNPQWLFAQASKPLVSDGINFLRGQYGYLR